MDTLWLIPTGEPDQYRIENYDEYRRAGYLQETIWLGCEYNLEFLRNLQEFPFVAIRFEKHILFLH